MPDHAFQPRSYPQQQASEIVKKSTDLMRKAKAPGLIAVFAEKGIVFAYAGMEPLNALRLLDELKRQLEESVNAGNLGAEVIP